MPNEKHLLVFILCISTCSAIKIASFNIQIFGKAKSQKTEVMKIISSEIRDMSGKAFKRLLMSVNKYNSCKRDEPKTKYHGKTSPRYGRTSSKEQYGVIYNPKKIKLISESEVAVSMADFERPPFCYSFNTVGRNPLTFAALTTHIDPDDVEAEMDNLYSTVAQCTGTTGTDDIIVLGDMNAGCRYLPQTKKQELKFSKDSAYRWLISDDMDTTVGRQDCAYDHFIVRGQKLIRRIVLNSAKPMKFDRIFNLKPDLAKAVSDHYPIEMEIV